MHTGCVGKTYAWPDPGSRGLGLFIRIWYTTGKWVAAGNGVARVLVCARRDLSAHLNI